MINVSKLSSEERMTIIAYACQQQPDQIAGLPTKNVTIRLIGRVAMGLTDKISLTIPKAGALAAMKAKEQTSVLELERQVQRLTPFTEAPVVVFSYAPETEGAPHATVARGG